MSKYVKLTTTNLKTMNGDILTNEQIFPAIKNLLLSATREIIVVVAWFTDRELLDILCNKQQEGVAVKLIVADSEINNKLDFSSLSSLGAVVSKIGQTGWGVMHHKFCIVDSKVAIHGSYNWTVNAKNNNQESITIIKDINMIDKLKGMYKSIIAEKTGKVEDLVMSNPNSHQENESEKVMVENKTKPNKVEFETILDQLIESEIYNFDRNKFKQEGFHRATSTSGDHKILSNTLDTLYAEFLNSLDIASEKKESIITQMNGLKNRKIAELIMEKDDQLYRLDIKQKSKEDEIDRNINEKSSCKLEKEAEKKKILETLIPHQHESIGTCEKEIMDLDIEYKKTKVYWGSILPALVLAIISFCYVVLFYSSAAYILLYSVADAKQVEMSGGLPIPTDIFDPQAFVKASEKGGTAIAFMVLFVIIPLGLGVLKKCFDNVTRAKTAFNYLGIFAVDGFIAYKVTKAIYEQNYLTGATDEKWELQHVFFDENFYLVLVLGALAIFLFKFSFEKIYTYFEERNENVVMKNNKVKIQSLKSQVIASKQKIKDLEASLIDLDLEINKANSEILNLTSDKSKNIDTAEIERSNINRRADVEKANLEDVLTIYEARINNNNIAYSNTALTDRVNTFVEGWTDYLHDTFSHHKAVEKSENAMTEKNTWLERRKRK